MVTRCLSLHATYACRHAGVCCSAHWVVQAEPHVVAFVQRNGLEPSRPAGDGPFVMAQSTKATQPQLAVAKDERGTCVFREDRRCTLHVVGGESVLPIGCRHYPRLVRIGHDSVALTLSHYCPTAASLLLDATPLAIVTAGPPLALAEPLDGLDTREALPPLLHPSMLTDDPGYAVWEHGVVAEFSRRASSRQALNRIASATDSLRDWEPTDGALDVAVRDAFAAAEEETPRWLPSLLPLVQSLNRGAVVVSDGEGLNERWTQLQPPGGTVDRVISNYLAARAFGNWIAYQGRGLRTVVAWLHACYDLVRLLAVRAADERGSLVMVHDVVEAVRQADYVMLHTIDSQAFARALTDIEA